jgi:hypothetical protein
MSIDDRVPPDDQREREESEALDELSRIIEWRLREQSDPGESQPPAAGAQERPTARPQQASPSGEDLEEEDDALNNEELRRLRARMRSDEEAYAREKEGRSGPAAEDLSRQGEDADVGRQPETAAPAPRQEPPPAGTPEQKESPRAGGEPPRESMSEGLRVLFRRQPEPEPPPEPAQEAVPVTRTGEESVYFLRFRRSLGTSRAPLETGLPSVDELLQGGLGPGLALVSARPPGCGRALALNLLWQAVTEERSALYYALATGAQRLWMDMIVMLSHLTEDNPLRPADLTQPVRARSRVARIQRLDALLARAFLPYLTVVETLPAGPHRLTAFLRHLERQLQGRNDLLVLDDLARLEVLLGVASYRERAALLVELEAVLQDRTIPGIVLTHPGWSGRRSAEDGLENLGSALLRLRPAGKDPVPHTSSVSLRVLKQPGSSRPGTEVRVLHDRHSGLFVEAPRR